MTIEEKIKQIEATGWLIHSGNRQEGIILLRKQINELLQMQAKNLQQSDVGGTLSTDEEIYTQIYRHLDMLPYAGGYPSDWKETLAAHLGKWFRRGLGNDR